MAHCALIPDCLMIGHRMYVVAGARSRWVRRQKVDLAELIDEPWVLPPPGSWMMSFVAEAFKEKGLGMPRVKVATYSAGLLQNLWDSGKFIGVAGGFTLRLLGKRLRIKALPIDLPVWPFPVALVMLKNRTVSPVVELFLKHVRAFMASQVGSP
jgi:DNA-binding transcriptional LysR family regulator